MAIKYKFRAFQPGEYTRTRQEWERQLKKLEGRVIPTEYTRILDWGAGQLDYEMGDTWVYGVFPIDSDKAVALADIVYRKTAKKWVKMLDLHLSPELDLGAAPAGDEPDLVPAAEIFTVATVGTAALTMIHKCTAIKLYGRSHNLLNFFKFVVDKTPAIWNEHGITVSIEGRWLVLAL